MICKKLLHCFILTIALPNLLFTQELNEISIYGYVKDTVTEKPISGVIVECINQQDTTQKYLAVSDITGRYIIDIITGIEAVSDENILPQNYRLDQNYPNPFNPATKIHFTIPQTGHIHLDIYNLLGQRVKTLVNNMYYGGTYSVLWDALDESGSKVPAGLYFYRFQSGDYVETKKMILLDGNVSRLNFNTKSLSNFEYSENKFSKRTNLMFTIRAKSARIRHYEQKNIMISSRYFRYDINSILLQTSVFDKEKIVLAGPGASGDVFVSGLAKAVVDTILGSEKVHVVNERTLEESSMRVEYDGGFRLMTFSGEAGDTFTFKLLSEGIQVGDTLQQILKPLKPPKVRNTNPTNGEKDVVVDTRCFIEFSQPMDMTTITHNSFIVENGGNVEGTINFNDNKMAVFTPSQRLQPSSTYTIKLTREIKDIWGIPLEQDFISTFTTAFEPVDTRIAFCTNPTQNPDANYINFSIHTMNSDGSEWHRLTKFSYTKDTFPNFSPDGKRIVFTRLVKEPINEMFSDIYVMNWDGTYPENLTNSPDYDEQNARFSPDGQKIVFSAISNEIDDNWDIFLMDLNGQKRMNLTNHPGWDYFPNWSPEGDYIVFVSDRDYRRGDIFIMKSDGTDPQNLTDTLSCRCQHPIWLPDGSKIAFFGIENNVEKVYLMDPDGTDLLSIQEGTFYDWGGMAWSPNSDRLVLIEVKDDPSLGESIFVINRDGTNKQRISDWGYYEQRYEGLSWSPKK